MRHKIDNAYMWGEWKWAVDKDKVIRERRRETSNEKTGVAKDICNMKVSKRPREQEPASFYKSFFSSPLSSIWCNQKKNDVWELVYSLAKIITCILKHNAHTHPLDKTNNGFVWWWTSYLIPTPYTHNVFVDHLDIVNSDSLFFITSLFYSSLTLQTFYLCTHIKKLFFVGRALLQTCRIWLPWWSRHLTN